MDQATKKLTFLGGASVLGFLAYKQFLRKYASSKANYYVAPKLSEVMKSPLPHQQFIAGKFVPTAGSHGTFPIIDPATEDEITRVPIAGAADVDAAVKAARACFEKGWGTAPAKHRSALLRSLATKVRENAERLAILESWNCGKPVKEAAWDMADVADCFDYFAGVAEDWEQKRVTSVSLPSEDHAAQVRLEAVGVVGAIIPWNYPLLMATWKLAPALASGCTIVLKPSEYTPLSLLELCALSTQVGFPAGAINVLTGNGPVTGEALLVHPGLDKLAFTGSVPTGKRVMHAAADKVNNVCLELGGKSAAIVFDDVVNIPNAVEWVMFGVFWTNGQICSSTSRLLIHEKIHAEFLRQLVAAVKAVKVGPPLASDFKDRTGTLGPVVCKRQYERVMGFINQAIAEGGQEVVLTGGKCVSRDLLPKGYFVEPTVIFAGNKDLTIWKEEVFGPVLTIKTFKDEAEAVRMANDTEFGLGGAVFTSDIDKANRVVANVRAGIMWVNCSQPCFSQLPWGGFKKSGVGRELGEYGFSHYLEPKTVVTYKDPSKPLAWYQNA